MKLRTYAPLLQTDIHLKSLAFFALEATHLHHVRSSATRVLSATCPRLAESELYRGYSSSLLGRATRSAAQSRCT